VIFLVGLDLIYRVPVTANSIIGILKIRSYGAKREAIEKTQMQLIDMTFARMGISPVSKKSLTPLPKKRFWTTKLYNLSDDLTKKPADIMRNIVPGNPGKTYPAIPNVKNTNPRNIRMSFFILLSILFIYM